MQPGLTNFYEIGSDNSTTHLTILGAKMNDADDKIGHPGKYKCTNQEALKSKTFYVTVVNHLNCR